MIGDKRILSTLEYDILKENSKISLNGIWKLEGNKSGEQPLMFDANVPSHVHETLLEANVIPDYNYKYNALECQWVEDWQWTYTNTFQIKKHDYAENVLVFEGLDTYAKITLNGIKIADIDNMFVEHKIDVSDVLIKGENTIIVEFLPINDAIKDLPLENYSSAFTQDRVFTRRMQCTYTWDWVHRFISYGIFKDVYIQQYNAKIDTSYIATRSISDNSAQLYIKTQVETDNEVRMSTTIYSPDKTIEFYENSRVQNGYNEIFPSIASPQLWWPATHGEQPLYTLKIEIKDKNDKLLDIYTQKFGIRTIVIEQIMDKPDSESDKFTKSIRARNVELEMRNDNLPGKSFTIVVNGKRVFLRGANWVPISPFPASDNKQRYERFVRLAKEAHMNVLRVWGGGLYAPDELLDACDEQGILVTQDFMMACGTYPIEYKTFENSLRYEFPLVIKRLRNHACLAWYNGDNELGMNGDFDDPNYSGRKQYDLITKPSLSEFDPYRDEIPTSPYGGRTNSAMTIGNTHYTCFLMDEICATRDTDQSEYRKYFTEQISRFVSEAVSFGAPSVPSLNMFMGENLDDNDMWDFHTKNHPQLSDYSLYDAAAMKSIKIFGESETTKLRVLKLEYVQYEWIRLLVENHRRHQFYNSGIIFWMFNDIWAASGWAMIDWYAFPKAGYYGMKKASTPIAVSVEETSKGWEIYVVNETNKSINGELMLFLQPFAGDRNKKDISKISFDIPINSAKNILKLAKSELDDKFDNSNILIAQINGDFDEKTAFCLYGMPKDMELEIANLKVERMGVYSGIIEITTDNYARVVCLMGDYDFADNYFDILPNTKIQIKYKKSEGNIDRNLGDVIECYAINSSCTLQL